MAKFQEIESAVASLDKQVKQLATDLKNLVSAVNSNSKGQTDLANNTKKVTGAVKQVSVVEKELENVRRRSLKVTKEVITEKEKLRQKTKALTDEVRKEQGTFQKSGGLFRSMTKSILAAGAAMISIRAAVTIFKNSIKTIANFEQAMSKVRAVTSAIPKDFAALQKSALNLGSTTSKTATEVAGLQLEFAKLGFSTKEILAATEATISLSIAAGSDLAESAVVAAGTIRGFGLNANETQRVVDVMAKSFSSSALDLEKFKTAMGAVAPVARANGKSLEFTTAQLSILSDANIDASTAGTSLRNMFLELSARGLTWEEGLAKINNSSNKGSTALDLFGKRGATAALVLAENIDKANGLEDAYNNAKGSAQEMADIMEDNLIGDTNKLSSAWEGFILGLNSSGGTISKVFRGLVKWLTSVVESLILVNKSYEEIVQDVKDENLAQTFKDDAIEVQFLSDKIGDYNRAVQLMIKQLEGLKNGEEENDAIINERISSLNDLIKTNKSVTDEIKDDNEDQIKSTKDTAEKTLKELKGLAEEVNAILKKAGIEVIDGWEELNDIVDEVEANIEEGVNAETKLILDSIDEQQAAKIKAFKDDQERRDKQLEDIVYALEGAAILTNAYAQIQQNVSDGRIQNIEAERDAEIAAAEKAGKDTSKIEAKYAKRLAAEKTKQAKKQKDAAIIAATIDTALAVVKTFASLGYPAGIVPAILVGLSGAAEIAAIASQPLPKFKHGTNGQLQLDTTAIVGDGGKPELITTPQGSFLSPSTDTMVHLPRGSQVFSGDSPETKAALSGGMSVEMYNGLINEQRLTRKAIQSKSITKEWTSKGLLERDNIRKIDRLWVDKYMR